MKGIIFTDFLELVEEKFGLEMVQVDRLEHVFGKCKKIKFISTQSKKYSKLLCM